MSSESTALAEGGTPTYLASGGPAFADYSPAWLANLANDVTLEGSMFDGAVQGVDAVRALVGGARELYDGQDFNFAGPWGNNGFVEDYTTKVRGRPLGAVHLITFNAEGQAQHIAANYRPLSSLMFFSRLLRERFAGTRFESVRGLQEHPANGRILRSLLPTQAPEGTSGNISPLRSKEDSLATP